MHLFTRGYHPETAGAAGTDVDRYQALRQRHNITAALAIGYEAEGIDPDNNAYLRSLVSRHPWMTTIAYLPTWPAPTPERLDELLAAGHRGIALHCLDAAAAEAVAGWPARVWSRLEGHGALVSLNSTPEAHPGLAELVRTTSGCQFLFSHVGQPGRYQQAAASERAAAQRLAALLALASSENCWVKISALYAISDRPYPYPDADPFVTVVLNAFGPGKCLWGSDFSPTLDHGTFEQALVVPQLSHLSNRERGQVMGGNLLQLLDR